jgi:hypothetical protein
LLQVSEESHLPLSGRGNRSLSRITNASNWGVSSKLVQLVVCLVEEGIGSYSDLT